MGVKYWLKSLGSSNNLYTSIRPLMLISLISGQTPLYISRGSCFEFTKLGFLATVIQCVIFAYGFVNSALKGQTLIGYFLSTEISVIGDTLHMLTSSIGVMSSIISCNYHRNYIVEMVHNLCIIDKRLKLLGVNIDYNRILKFSYIIGLVITIFNFIYVVGSYSLLFTTGVNPDLDVFFVFSLPFVEFCILVFMFLSITRLIFYRFKLLKKILKNMLQNPFEQQNSISKFQVSTQSIEVWKMDKYTQFRAIKMSPNSIIREISNIHHLLHDTCRLGERFFSYQILVIIAIAFLFIIFDDYYILDMLISKISQQKTNFNVSVFIIFLSGEMILYLALVLAIVEGSSRTIAENDKIAVYVHKLLQQANNKDFEDKLVQFSMQLMHRKVRFTAAGLFNLDRTLLFTLSGAVTTYLIILLQFRTSEIGIIPDGNFTLSNDGIFAST